jgi:hypothetical protein
MVIIIFGMVRKTKGIRKSSMIIAGSEIVRIFRIAVKIIRGMVKITKWLRISRMMAFKWEQSWLQMKRTIKYLLGIIRSRIRIIRIVIKII